MKRNLINHEEIKKSGKEYANELFHEFIEMNGCDETKISERLEKLKKDKQETYNLLNGDQRIYQENPYLRDVEKITFETKSNEIELLTKYQHECKKHKK